MSAMKIRSVGSRRSPVRGFPAATGLLGLILFLGGCPMAVTIPPDGTNGNPDDGNPPPVTPTVDGNQDPSLTSPLGKTSGEPNDTFMEPIVAVFGASGVAHLQGVVAEKGDLDVYLLGSLAPGDRLIVDAHAKTIGSVLDVSLGIYDAEERLVYTNDDRTEEDLDSYVDWVVRHAGDRYYLVVTGAAFAAEGEFTGAYTLEVTVMGGGAVPVPVRQIIVLDFDGGMPDAPALQITQVDPFDAAGINSIYRDRTELIKATIRLVMEQNYERFNVLIRTTDDPPPAAGVKFTTMYFGGFHPNAFGISEHVDAYDVDRCDDGIIFTDSFSVDAFSFLPTAEEMGIAIGNVGAHEAGHLLGLNHVDDDLDLMDDRSAADAFIEDQEFLDSPVSRDIMPIGTQDSVLLLLETVGAAPP